jgi:predicted HAD superfamily Cof-like phosphohydrolase
MKTDERKVMEFHVKNKLALFLPLEKPSFFVRFILKLFYWHLQWMSWVALKLSKTQPNTRFCDGRSCFFRLHLCLEEIAETVLAILHQDLVELADALADLLYVTHGLGLTYGVSTNLAFNEVHRSNMTKDFKTNSRRGYKGEDWTPPDTEMVVEQGYEHLVRLYREIQNDSARTD